MNIQRLLIPVALLVVAAMVVLATSLWVRHQGPGKQKTRMRTLAVTSHWLLNQGPFRCRHSMAKWYCCFSATPIARCVPD
ncbi:MAG: hypothetical protein CM1200mP20_14530 [Pseudomonadota bacterium]|nr:MAG: hypothetical protein CM1200mP20_14530 [Pseudomonadota bacterium]